jgi:hypothetical protein
MEVGMMVVGLGLGFDRWSLYKIYQNTAMSYTLKIGTPEYCTT